MIPPCRCRERRERRERRWTNDVSTYKPWHIFVGYQVVNAFAFLFNCYGKVLPAIAHTTLYTSLVSFFVTLVVVPARAPSHQDAHFVFANFVNATGWKQNGIGKCISIWAQATDSQRQSIHRGIDQYELGIRVLGLRHASGGRSGTPGKDDTHRHHGDGRNWFRHLMVLVPRHVL